MHTYQIVSMWSLRPIKRTPNEQISDKYALNYYCLEIKACVHKEGTSFGISTHHGYITQTNIVT